MLVSEIERGGRDAAGNDVAWVYSRNPPDYAVYRVGNRIMVHFADSADRAKTQSVALAPLTPLRGEIAGLIDSWRDGSAASAAPGGPTDAAITQKSDRYNMRVAEAFIVALQGDLVNAQLLLEGVKTDILAERTAVARFWYLSYAFGAMALLLLISKIGLIDWVVKLLYPTAQAGAIWTVLGAGALGAFFSIAIGIRARSVPLDLRFLNNACDATLRVLIGVVAAGVLLALYRIGLVASSPLDPAHLPPGTGPFTILFVIGFMAGFFERLVPDMLAKIDVDLVSNQAAAAVQRPAAAAAAERLSATSAEGAAGTADKDEESDDCPGDIPPVPGEAETADGDLPAASGGIAEGDAAPAAADEGGGDADGDDGDDGENGHDGCLCDTPSAPDEAGTADENLPAASGGVAGAIAPPPAAGDDRDDCPGDAPPAEGEAETGDHDLPAAAGGVAGAPLPSVDIGDDAAGENDACPGDIPPVPGEDETADENLPAAQGGIADR